MTIRLLLSHKSMHRANMIFCTVGETDIITRTGPRAAGVGICIDKNSFRSRDVLLDCTYYTIQARAAGGR